MLLIRELFKLFDFKKYSSFNSVILIDPSPQSYFDYTKLDENWFDNLKQSLVRIPKEHESSQFWLDKAYALQEACLKFNTSFDTIFRYDSQISTTAFNKDFFDDIKKIEPFGSENPSTVFLFK